MLVATAEREGIGATATPEPRPQRAARTPRARRAQRAESPASVWVRGPRARTAVIAGVAVGAVAFAGMSTASGNAIPGDALYGVKRSTERAQLALASSDVSRAQLYLDFARTRLNEAHAVSGGLDRVLTDMDREAIAGVSLLTAAAANRRDPAALDPIEQFVADQRRALDELAILVDDSEQARIDQSRDLLDDIAERATELRSQLDLGCLSATSIDVLGAEPSEECVTLPAPDSLAPSDEAAPGQAPAQPETGRPGQPDPDRTDPSRPDAPSTSTDENAPPAATDDGGPLDLLAPEEDPAAADEEVPQPTDEGGLLTNLNRLLGNLLAD
jgi:hypothetical protein